MNQADSGKLVQKSVSDAAKSLDLDDPVVDERTGTMSQVLGDARMYHQDLLVMLEVCVAQLSNINAENIHQVATTKALLDHIVDILRQRITLADRWVTVPKQPTVNMCDAAILDTIMCPDLNDLPYDIAKKLRRAVRRQYVTMLAAAPKL